MWQHISRIEHGQNVERTHNNYVMTEYGILINKNLTLSMQARTVSRSLQWRTYWSTKLNLVQTLIKQEACNCQQHRVTTLHTTCTYQHKWCPSNSQSWHTDQGGKLCTKTEQTSKWWHDVHMHKQLITYMTMYAYTPNYMYYTNSNTTYVCIVILIKVAHLLHWSGILNRNKYKEEKQIFHYYHILFNFHWTTVLLVVLTAVRDFTGR